MRVIVFSLLLLVASAAQAQQWRTCDPAVHAGGRILNNPAVKPRDIRIACYDFNDATTDSVTLNVIACENHDVRFNSNTASTTNTCTVQIMGCTGDTANVNTCEVIANVTLDGDPATGTDKLEGSGEAWIYVVVVANPSSHACRVMVICNP